jgi:hypothetical protein
MDKEQKNKNFKNVMLAFSCVDTCLQLKASEQGLHYFVEREKESLKNVLEEKKIQYERFYCWGYFDIVEYMEFDDRRNFVELQKLVPYTHTYDQRYCIGLQTFSTSYEKDFDKHPLVGISSIKFKDEMFKNMKTDKYTEFFASIFPEYVENSISAISENISGVSSCNFLPNSGENTSTVTAIPSAEFSIIWSFGWEDAILITFSNSYELIKRLVCKIRNLKFQDKIISKTAKKEISEKEHIHCCLFSSTNFAFYLKGIGKNTEDESFKNLKKKIIKDNFLVADVKLRTRPGHLDFILEKLTGKGDAYPSACLGRNDVHLRFGKKVDFLDFIDYYTANILPFFKNPDNPVTHAETSFRCEADKWEGKKPCKNTPRNFGPLLIEADKKLLQNLESLQKETVIATLNLISWIRFFEENPFLKSSMNTILPPLNYTFDYFSKSYKYLKLDEISNILAILMETTPRVLEDRFRGNLPIAETGYSSRTIYKGNIQKLLSIYDYVSFKIYTSLWNDTSLLCCWELPLCSFTTFIPGHVSPFIMQRVLSFWKLMGIQIENIFIEEHVHLLFHEIGHAFWAEYDGFFIKDIEERIKKERKPPQFSESLNMFFKWLPRFILWKSWEEGRADLFWFSIGFNKNIDEWIEKGKNSLSYLKVPNKFITDRINGVRLFLGEQTDCNLKKFLELLKNGEIVKIFLADISKTNIDGSSIEPNFPQKL